MIRTLGVEIFIVTACLIGGTLRGAAQDPPASFSPSKGQAPTPKQVTPNHSTNPSALFEKGHRWGWKEWLAIGGSVLAVGALAAVASSGGHGGGGNGMGMGAGTGGMH